MEDDFRIRKILKINTKELEAAILDFSKILFYAKLLQILLKLVENMCLQPQNRNIIKKKV